MSGWLSHTWAMPNPADIQNARTPQQHASNLRNYTPSPLGRRPTAPQFDRQTSGLSMAGSPHGSTTSLSSMGRQQQERLGYRKAVTMEKPGWVTDPMVKLETMLGVDAGELAGAQEKKEKVEEDFPSLEEAETVDFGGARLEDFLARVEEDGSGVSRTEKTQEECRLCEEQGEVMSVGEVLTRIDEQEKERFLDLQRSIKSCDEVLKSVEAYLSSFQNDLGAVSAEIESLQNRSMTLNYKLESKKTMEKLLGPIIDDIILPPDDVRKLVEGDVNESWVKALYETERRMKAIEGMDAEKIQAIQEVKPELEKLTHKVTERIRDFFVARIKALRHPGANAQHIQQSAFIRYKDLFQFIVSHHPQLADEIGQAYINTMRWYYITNFTKYYKSLERIRLHVMTESDALGTDHHKKTTNLLSSFTVGGSSKASTSGPAAYDPFTIGRRVDILHNRTAPILTSQQAEDDRTTHFPEYPFRHFNAALIENTSSEYTFLTDFFPHKNLSQIATMFSQIWTDTFSLAQSFTKQLIDPTFDAIAVLICVRLNQDATFETQRRKIPTTEAYLNATNMLLWPRLQIIISGHCESLRKITAATPSTPITAKAAAAAVKSGKAESQSAAPHPLTQKFASLLHALLALSEQAGDDEPIANGLMRLRGDYEALIERLGMHNLGNEERKMRRFLFNNFSLVGTIIGDTDGKLATEQKAHFEALRKKYEEKA